MNERDKTILDLAIKISDIEDASDLGGLDEAAEFLYYAVKKICNKEQTGELMINLLALAVSEGIICVETEDRTKDAYSVIERQPTWIDDQCVLFEGDPEFSLTVKKRS